MNRNSYIIFFAVILICISVFLIADNTTTQDQKCKDLLELAEESLLIDPQQSFTYALEASQIKNLSSSSRADCFCELAKIDFKLQNYDYSLQNLDKAFDLASKENDFEKIASIQDYRSKIFISKKEYETADSLLTSNIKYRLNHKLSLIITKEIRGIYYHELQNPAKEITLYLAILEEIRAEKDIEHLARILHWMGDAYRNLSEYNSAFDSYHEAYLLYETMNNSIKMGRLLHGMGTVKKQLGDYDTALHYYFRALKFKESNDTPSRIASTLRNIGNIHKKIGDKDEALKYFSRTLEYVEKTGNHKLIGAALISIGTTYNSLGNYDKAEEYYSKATPHIKASGDKTQLAGLYHNLAYLYKINSNYAKAETYYKKGLAILRKNGNRHGQVRILVNLGGLYITTGQHDIAEDCLMEALRISKQIGTKDKTKDIYEGLLIHYAKIGKFQKAYEYSQLYATINDSIYNTQKTQAIASIQEKYEAEKRDKEITELEQITNKQKIELMRSKLIFWQILAVLAILVLISFFAIRRYYKKNKQAKELESIVNSQKQSLQETINDLRNTTLAKKQAEMKQIVFKENFETLYKTALEFLRLTSEDDIYKYLVESIHEMIGDSIIIVSSYNKHSNILQCRAITGLKTIEDKFIKILGRHPLGMNFDLPEYSRNILKQGKLYRIKGGFHEFTFYSIPHHITEAIIRLAKIGDIYTIGFHFEDELWGNASIMLTNGNILKNISGLEAFINQAAMAIQRRHAQIDLQDSEDKYRRLVEEINDAIIVIQEDKIILFNKRFSTLLGFEENKIQTNSLKEILCSNIQNKLDPILDKIISSDKEYHHVETQITHSSGREIFVDIRSSFIIYDRHSARLLVIRDITDMKIAQKQILYTERLSGLGELAAGVAHEIKNPLGNISSSAQIITSDYDLPKEAKMYLDIIQRNVENANKTIMKLTDFATPNEINMRPANIIEVIDTMCHLLKGKLRNSNIVLEKDFHPIPDLIIDPVLIQGVMVNIVLNAIQAQENGGALDISVRQLDEEIIITFKDNGCGISLENQNRIFNPFFTTKEEGAGLGLSMAYKIMLHHHGTIDVVSKLNEGTSVTLHFPLKW